MGAPLVETKQDGSIRIQDLTKVVMARRRLELSEERLVPFEATGNIADADDRPRAFHRSSFVALTFALTRDGAFLLSGPRGQVQRVVQQGALSLGGPPWPCGTAAAQPVLHRQV